MNKQQFLAALRGRLYGLPQADIEKSLDFYAEMIDDRVEDGLTEEQAVLELGPVDEIAEQILLEQPLPRLVKAKMRPSHTLRAWEVVLLILGAPVWLPLLLAAVAVLLSVYVVVWAIVVVFYSLDLSLAASCLAGIIGGAVLAAAHNGIQILLVCFGAGLICAGLTILLFFACNQIALGVIRFSGWFLRLLKSQFIRKGDAA